MCLANISVAQNLSTKAGTSAPAFGPETLPRSPAHRRCPAGFSPFGREKSEARRLTVSLIIAILD